MRSHPILQRLLAASLAVVCALALSGCDGCVAPGMPDAGEPPRPPVPPFLDGGPDLSDAGPIPDAGLTYSPLWAGEACPPESYAPVEDAGVPAGARTFGLCIALRTLSGKAEHNRQPVAAPITLDFVAGNYGSTVDCTPDGTGKYETRVMRARYDQLKYHPSTIFPTHSGPVEFGVIDMTQDRMRDLAVRSWSIRGAVSFGGVPWRSVTYPPDVQLGAAGIPGQQGVAASTVAGSYEAALIEGQFGVGVAVPRDALGDTELLGFPVVPAMALAGDSDLDIHLPTSELSGELTIDGQPFPNRRNGEDYLLQYVLPGAQQASVVTFHEGGNLDFRGLVPKGKYAVSLELKQARDRQLPSMLYNKQLGVGLDLNRDLRTNFSLTTHVLEGALLVDGVAVAPNPNAHWLLYAYAYGSQTEPGFLAYYEVPLDRASFTLRVFPSRYYLGLYLTDMFAPDLVEGWLIVDRAKEVHKDDTLPIDILTSVLDVKLLVDGKPNVDGQLVGTLYLQGKTDVQQGFYRKQVVTRPDGTVRLRVPKGTYDISFAVDPATYPGYATGMQRMLTNVSLESPRQVELDYKTIPVSGPLRVGGEVVPDTHYGQPEVGLILRRTQDNVSFTWSFSGGASNYVLRVPKGDYALTFEIEPEALPGVAWGTAPMGIKLVAQ